MEDKSKNPEAKPSASEEEGDVLLPTLTGAAKAVDNAGVTKSLLGPVSKVVGDRWGKSMQEWFDARDTKRAENLQSHQEKVRVVEHLTNDQKTPTERQVAVLVEWAEQAQTVDPETEGDLAALWQSLLGDIYRNDIDSAEVLEVLKQLSRADANALLKIEPDAALERGRLDHRFLTKFQNLGVVEPINPYNILQRLSLNAALGAICVGAGLALPEFFAQSEIIEVLSAMKLLPPIFIVAGITLIAFAGASALNFIGRYRLTALGKKLVLDARRYQRL